ncbi:sugar transferase [Kaistia geumhonensis]|uniref:Lipopolysaccharide/colanic/teichoic acid biosynthesis glycosyltransferase n=1 Tax=Kaistia geumhonensis TaxID=410839 RepID=A0ABU0M9X4_9HYPH|nr:sugar transferase [Kaistia geumhonensis]MCX5480723.1 sugar transferase [Kaistia geumhonensis]MDQ0517573.1 lipopolysaccharide/colanic/teichoic acid biosynthesis glycosyltransferase [Kaistia geumhonensis]
MSLTTATPEILATVDRRVVDAELPVASHDATPAAFVGDGQTTGHRQAESSRRQTSAALGRSAAILILLAADALAMLAAAAFLWATGTASPYGDPSSAVLAFAAILTLAQFALVGLYPGYGLYDHEQIRRRASASGRTAIAVLPPLVIFGAVSTVIPVSMLLALALCIQPIGQYLARRTARSLGIWGTPATIFGTADAKREIAEFFRRHWQLGITPHADDAGSASRQGERRLACLTSSALPSLAEMGALREKFADIILLADTPNVKISGLQPSAIGGSIGLRIARGNGSTPLAGGRRLLDLAIAIPAALVAAPIVAIAAAGIYAVDPGPVFFRQRREGLAGEPIDVLKLRTMYRNAEARLEALFAAHPEMRLEWQAHFKLRQDPRILPLVGRLLRASSCDELPQLWNVIIGEMSIVGPRPFPDYHLAAMSSEFREKRCSVVPGLTGLWQVSERSEADLERQRQIDEFYIDNRSVWLDCHILLKTIPAVLGRGGAY